ncbi:MAG: DNA-formamidopyrimidine glycosylase family protein [Acidobacteriota bacterium]
MPEGDTIWRAARTLQRVLGGQRLIAARSEIPAVDRAALAGHTVARVESRGKNLLIHLDDGRVLHTHMRMSGSWHVYRPGERWQRPQRQAKVVLETDRFVAVCFNAPVVELLSAGELRRHPALSRLGPDVLSPDFDPARTRLKIRARSELAIGEALIAQSALAGVGNIYKSETLFLCGMDPFRLVRDLSDRDIDRLVAKARTLMSANLGTAPRATRPSLSRERTWVYGRRGRPCRRCTATIQMGRQGTQARSTYWCPTCQPKPDERPARP